MSAGARIRRFWRVYIVANECADCAGSGRRWVVGTRYVSPAPGATPAWLCTRSALHLGIPNPEQDDR